MAKKTNFLNCLQYHQRSYSSAVLVQIIPLGGHGLKYISLTASKFYPFSGCQSSRSWGCGSSEDVRCLKGWQRGFPANWPFAPQTVWAKGAYASLSNLILTKFGVVMLVQVWLGPRLCSECWCSSFETSVFCVVFLTGTGIEFPFLSLFSQSVMSA